MSKFLKTSFLLTGLHLGAILPVAAQAQTDVIVGWPATMTVLVAPIVMGNTLGLFEAAGLNVSLAEFRGTSGVLPQLTNGSIQIGHIGADPLIALKQTANPAPPVRLFYNATPQNIWDFIVPAESPIQSIEDLKGSKIGVQVLTNFHMPVTRSLLSRHGLVEDQDYSFLPIGYGGQALFALQRGDVETYYIGLNETAAYRSLGAELRTLPMDADFKGMIGGGYATTEAFMAEKPEVVSAFGRVITQTTILCHEVPKACVEALWKTYPATKPKEAETEAGVTAAAEVMKALMASYIPMGVSETVQYGAYDAKAIENMIAILHEGGQLQSKDVDLATIYTNDFVSSFNDFDWPALRQTIAGLVSH